MKILLSPAKSINEQGEYPAIDFTTPTFSKEAKSLAKKLKKLKSKQIMDLMHVSAEIADLNVKRYKHWYLSDTPTDEVRPSGFLFTGEVYKGLDIPSLSAGDLEKAQERVRILSGMYGLLKPLDLIFPYRLEMGTQWEMDEKFKNLYQFWGAKLTKSLQKETSKDEWIVNLASHEYAKAIKWKEIKRKVVVPTFKEYKNGETKVIMIFAKHARGAMARYLVQNDLQSIEDLKGYNVDGYSFDEKNSTETDWLFVR